MEHCEVMNRHKREVSNLEKTIKITASCVISRQRVIKNGKQLFSSKETAVPEFLASVYNFLQPEYPKFYKMDNLSKLGWLASEVLLKNSFISKDYKPEDTGIILSNANSSLDTDLRYFQTVPDYPSPSLFVYTLPNIVIGEICIRNNFQGENAFFIFEKLQPGFIEQYASSLVNSGILQSCICGWVDILEGEYNAALFLVENRGKGEDFTAANMIRMFGV